ncbi:MAG: CocE/NonD family hydrolase [Vicinamibacterales bacterium]
MAQGLNGRAGVECERDLCVRMRDGVMLRTDVYRPARHAAYPVLLLRSIAGGNDPLVPLAQGLACRGYAVVVQSVRGCNGSGGVFEPFVYESCDGSDTVDWLVKATWSDGRVGLLGIAYSTFCNYAIAGNAALGPHIKCAVCCSEIVDPFHVMYRGGVPVLQWAHHLSSRAPQDGHYLRECLEHRTYDAYWKNRSLGLALRSISMPTLHVTGWRDCHVEQTLTAYQELNRRGVEQRLIVGPWTHEELSEPVEPSGATSLPGSIDPLAATIAAWIDRHMRCGGVPIGPPVRFFVMGKNEWTNQPSWIPPAVTWKKYHLAGSGRLSAEPPELPLAEPLTCQTGEPLRETGTPRFDMVSYATEALTTPLLTAGSISAVLVVSTSECDADIAVTLVDEAPDGQRTSIVDGIVRLSYRESALRRLPTVPRIRYKVNVPLGTVAHEFGANHRIRLNLTAISAPTQLSTSAGSAEHTLHMGGVYPSYVRLPVWTESGGERTSTTGY